MINVRGTNQTNQLMFYRGVKVGELFIPCQCIIFVSFIGFGLSLMGMIMTATSHSEPEMGFNNPFKIVGPILLSIGLLFLCVCIVLCVAAVKGRRQQNAEYLSCQGEPGNVFQSNCYPPPQPFAQAVYPYPITHEHVPPPSTNSGVDPPPYNQAVFDIGSAPPLSSDHFAPQPAYNPSVPQTEKMP